MRNQIHHSHTLEGRQIGMSVLDWHPIFGNYLELDYLCKNYYCIHSPLIGRVTRLDYELAQYFIKHNNTE